jgi:hypothetical protein
MTGIGKKRRKVSANSSAPFHFYENCMAVSIFIHLHSPRFIGGQLQTFTVTIKGHHGSRCQNLESAKKSCLLGAGGTGNVQEKTFLINCSGIAGQDRNGGGINPHERKNSPSHGRNSFFPAAYHSAVLRVGSCDSSVAQYSRSDARSV